MKITSVLLVDEIEKSLTFWVERMGFEKTVEVPEGDRLGFVILVRDGAELMLQTIASGRKDAPVFVPEGTPARASLFIEVEDFADVLKRLEGYPIALAERTTFYGMREIGVIEPGGHNAIFAART
jgi:catechol 2,3-dioxygenase-like lactoylglutathione lyase family enzyme